MDHRRANYLAQLLSMTTSPSDLRVGSFVGEAGAERKTERTWSLGDRISALGDSDEELIAHPVSGKKRQLDEEDQI